MPQEQLARITQKVFKVFSFLILEVGSSHFWPVVCCLSSSLCSVPSAFSNKKIETKRISSVRMKSECI
uniref:Uncharacterized protein n=1 Tax=Anguilla anguilla TaxID=7936 RepID=A0A0E9QMB5_ANGAN